MQVSIYLDESMVEKIDQRVKRIGKSRSQWIQSILESALSRKKPKTVFDEVFGILSPSEAQRLAQTIREGRVNSPRFQS